MVAYGARGETATAMAHVLPEEVSPPPSSLQVANSVWISADTVVLPTYQSTLETTFDAAIKTADFRHPAKAIQQINTWVADQTRGKISDLFHQGDIDTRTRLVLTNAAHFTGSWLKPFDPSDTQHAPFFALQQEATDVAMMSQCNRFPYFENEEFQLLSLSFAGDESVACLILLPKGDLSLEEIENGLSTTTLQTYLNALRSQKVALKIPRFQLHSRMDLNQTLQDLGMGIAFTEQADFSGINGHRNLLLSKVVHEATLDFDEKGVTATAATGASIGLTAALDSHQPPRSFVANHPFLFFLVDQRTQNLLFMGKLVKPC